MDGFNNVNGRNGGSQAKPPINSIQEFKMQTAGYSAEYGRLAGGVMNTVLKSGGNQFHGGLFEFWRNDLLDARNFFAVNKPKLRRNQFGADLSGPVFLPKLYNGRDRTFFMFSWESYRQITGEARRSRVPSALEQAGDFSQSVDTTGKPFLLADPLSGGTCSASNKSGCFPGNLIPASRIDPIAKKILSYYPAPNWNGVNNYVTNHRGNWDTLLAKIDQRFSDRDSISGRYLVRNNDRVNPFQGSDLGTFGSAIGERMSLFGLTYNRMFTPTLINEVRAGVTRTTKNEHSYDADVNIAATFGIPGTTTDPTLFGSPRFSVKDYVQLGDGPGTPIIYTTTDYQAADSLTWVKGRHLLKFGGDMVRTQSNQQSSSNGSRGQLSFQGKWTNSSVADLLLGLLDNTSRQVGSNPAYLRWTNLGFFAQDDFKVHRNLTLNLGLRYELWMAPTEKFGRMSNFVPETGKLIVADDRCLPNLNQVVAGTGLQDKVGLARDFGIPSSLIHSNYKRVAPRFGMAWRPFGGNRTVIRGGYGIFYGASVTDQIRGDMTGSFPLTYSQTFSRKTNDPLLLTLSSPFPTAQMGKMGTVSVNGYDLDAPAQYMQNWNLSAARELGIGYMLEAGYSGSKGTHLGRRYDFNQPYRGPQYLLPDGTYPRPIEGFASINRYSFGSNSVYNSGTVTFQRRFQSGMFYRVSYVFSKSIDDASQLAGNASGGYPGAQDARNLRGERGRSDFDAGHALMMSFSYEMKSRHSLIRGWQISGSGRAYTGQPFTPRVSGADTTQGEANRPDRIAKGTIADPTPELWFDKTAFPLVPRGSFRMGNSGRNILDAPGRMALNFALMKNFRFRERDSLQFRWEAFNATNHTSFDIPNVNVNALNGGTITNADGARSMQFGLRYQF
jgi:hypothetical protein